MGMAEQPPDRPFVPKHTHHQATWLQHAFHFADEPIALNHRSNLYTEDHSQAVRFTGQDPVFFVDEQAGCLGKQLLAKLNAARIHIRCNQLPSAFDKQLAPSTCTGTDFEGGCGRYRALFGFADGSLFGRRYVAAPAGRGQFVPSHRMG